MDSKTYSVPCIYPLSGMENRSVRVSVPGSKSITNRALLLATLADGASTLQGALFSDDSRHFLKCIQDLGFETQVNEEAKEIKVTGHSGLIPKKEASQYVGSAGTAARFLTALLGVSEGVYHMDSSEQMRRRPMEPLLRSLMELGCAVTYEGAQGCFPFTLKGHGFGRDSIKVDIGHSSQFLSALLICGCLSPQPLTLEVEGTHGMAYIEMTRKMMEQFGVSVLKPSAERFVIPKGQHYRALDYTIEPDVSAACYFYALAPLLNLPVLVEKVHFNSLQGDVEFIRILEKMGCSALDTPDGILVNPPFGGRYHGVDVNMSACSDQAITLAAIAPFADSPTTIRGIGHIRCQESNRMEGIVTELGKMGILCRETEQNLTIYPGSPSASTVNTYEDHRMAMGFSLTGLRAPGVVIDNPGCCRKTFENYFETLEQIIKTL